MPWWLHQKAREHTSKNKTKSKPKPKAKEEDSEEESEEKTAKKHDMPSFTRQDRPEKVKEVYRALKREYGESMPAATKARIAERVGRGKKQGPPYKGPLTGYGKAKKHKKRRHRKKGAAPNAFILGAFLGTLPFRD